MRRARDLGGLFLWLLVEGCGGSSQQPPSTVVQAAADCLPCLGRCAADLIALRAAHGDAGPAVVDGGAR